MTGFNSKRGAAADKLQEPVDIASIIACREMLDAQPVPARSQYMIEEDDDIQVYKRPWVGLTDEEIDAWTPEIHGVIRSIEQVLKEKNGCDHTQLLEMLAYRAECFPNYPIGGHIPEVFAALGRPIPIGDLLAQPPLPVQEPVCDKDPQGCWNVRCQLGKQCKNLVQPAPGYCKNCKDYTIEEPLYAQPVQEPVARVTGVYGGRFTYDPINRAAILPVGMALYAGPA